MNIIRVGTRGSALALKQVQIVADLIHEKHPEIEIQNVIIKTSGDKITDKSLAAIGGKGLFLKEIEERLAAGDIDIAVHSGKDMPSYTPEPFIIPAVLPREDDADLFIIADNNTNPDARKALEYISNLQNIEDTEINNDRNFNITIGTSSPRREELIKRLLPGSSTVLLRGNVPTRLTKLAEGECDATLLASAGIKRLGIDLVEKGITAVPVPDEYMIPASCQGIIAVETITGNPVADIISEINDANTKFIFDHERALMKMLNADCHDAAAVNIKYLPETKNQIKISAFYKNSDIAVRICNIEEIDTAVDDIREQIKLRNK